jgi:sporulation protein YlmC with PRC-barrel domain
MSETAEYDIGAEVLCSDGACGVLQRVIVDPVARQVTHLVVEPRQALGGGHLVPIDLVSATPGVVQLSCSTAEFEALEPAEEGQFLPGAPGSWGYGQHQMMSWPFFALAGMGMMGMGRRGFGGMGIGRMGLGGMGLGGIGMGMAMGGMGMGGMGTGMRGPGMGAADQAADNVPEGEVEVRRGDPVHASDGTIGRLHGLVIDPRDHKVSHLLLDEGHLWGQKRVAIPISAVSGVEDGVHLSLTKDEVRDLPSVDLDQTK